MSNVRPGPAVPGERSPDCLDARVWALGGDERLDRGVASATVVPQSVRCV